MPALPDVPNVLRIDLHHTETDDPSLANRLFFQYVGAAPSATQLDTFCQGVANAWVTNLAPLAGSWVVMGPVVCTDLTSPTSARGSYTAGDAGTRAGTRLGIDTCALLNFQIGRRYRGGKPRIYAPWGVEGDLDSSSNRRWSSAFVTEVNTAYGVFQADILSAVIGTTTIDAQVNVSYYKGFVSSQNPVTLRWRTIPTLRPGPITPDPITSFDLNPLIGTQRRRVRA